MPNTARVNQKILSTGDFGNANITTLKIGGVTVTPTAAEMNVLAGIAADAAFTIGAESSNARTVSIQLLDANGDELVVPAAVKGYLATDSAGMVPATVAPSGGIAAGTDGAILEWGNNLSGLFISEADGDIDVVITESGTATWRLVLIMPTGELVISNAIAFS